MGGSFFAAARAPRPPFPPGGPRGARSLASPETGAATPLNRSKCVARYIEFCAAGKPAAGGHDVPGPRRGKGSGMPGQPNKYPRPEGGVLRMAPGRGQRRPCRIRSAQQFTARACLGSFPDSSRTSFRFSDPMQNRGSTEVNPMQFLSSIASVLTMPRGHGFLCCTKRKRHTGALLIN